MRYIFITGTSRGLGEASMEVFKEDRIISISRSPIDESYDVYKSFNIDFDDTAVLENNLDSIFNSISLQESDEVYLLNSAGIVTPIKPVAEMTAEDYLSNYKINVLAPAMLIKGFINGFKEHNGTKRILTISSGAAVNPVEGWAAYCSSKAAMNMLSDVTRVETSRLDRPVESAVFSPGVMDTDMQGEIRGSDSEAFPDIERFKEYKTSGRLNSALTVAKVVKEVITSKNFSHHSVYNVTDYL